MEHLEKFLQNYRVKKFLKGEIILCEGEVPPVVYVVKKGIVKNYNLTRDGQEKPIAFDLPLEFFPIGWAFNKLERCQYYYEAFTDCEVYCVTRDDLVHYVVDNPSVLKSTFNFFLTRYLNYHMRINALEQSKASDKVLNTLHFLCLRYGEDVKQDVVRIMIPLTQQDLANFMGLTRETTGIELKKLEKSGVLTYSRQNYIVRTDKLNTLLDDDYESGRLKDDQSFLAANKPLGLKSHLL